MKSRIFAVRVLDGLIVAWVACSVPMQLIFAADPNDEECIAVLAPGTCAQAGNTSCVAYGTGECGGVECVFCDASNSLPSMSCVPMEGGTCFHIGTANGCSSTANKKTGTCKVLAGNCVCANTDENGQCGDAFKYFECAG